MYTSVHTHTHTPTYDSPVYFVCMWPKMCECVCLASPAGWSSGIQQPLLKCQSGLTELGKAQAAVLDFSHHPATPAHKLTNTHIHISPPCSLHRRPRPDELCCFLCPSLFISPLFSLSLSLLQDKTRRWKARRGELITLLRYIIYAIVYWDSYILNSCHKY